MDQTIDFYLVDQTEIYFLVKMALPRFAESVFLVRVFLFCLWRFFLGYVVMSMTSIGCYLLLAVELHQNVSG